MMKGMKIAVYALCVGSLGGCADSLVEPDNLEGIEGGTYFGTKASVGKCIYAKAYDPFTEVSTEAGLLAPVAEAVVGSLITRGIGKFGEALKKAGEEKTVSVVVTANFEAGPQNVPECIQIVRGTFARNASSTTYPANTSPDLHGAYKQAGFPLVGQPDFFFEGRFKRSVDGQALAIQTSRFDYHRLFDRRKPTKGEKRGLVLEFAFLPPGEAVDSQKATNVILSLGDVGDGDAYGGTTFRGVERLHYAETPWFKAPFSIAATTSSPPVTTGGAGSTGTPSTSGPRATPSPPSSVTTPGSASPDTNSNATGSAPVDAPSSTAGATARMIEPKSFKPVTVQTTIAETRDANQFLLFLGGIFEDSKDELETALKQIALKSEREKYLDQQRANEISAASQQLTLLNAYHDSVGAAEKALLAYCEDADQSSISRIDRSVSARKAQLGANQNALAASVTAPYATAELVPISTGGPADSACR